MHYSSVCARWRIKPVGLVCLLAVLASSCAVTGDAPGAHAPALRQVVQIPLIDGWYQGRLVQYITTDVSDREMALKLGANYAPRLADAIPELPRTPGQRSSVERLYMVTNFAQANIAPSAPVPAGGNSKDRAYSPLWQMFMVTWLPGTSPRTLRSSDEVLEAADRGLVSVTATDIVVNCPIVYSDQGGLLPGTRRLGG